MKISKTKAFVAALIAVAMGASFPNAAQARRDVPPKPAVIQPVLPSADDAAISPSPAYRLIVLNSPVLHRRSGRQADAASSYDDIDVALVRVSDGRIERQMTMETTGFDMSPDGMGTMHARAELSGDYAGAYHLKLYPDMTGHWQVELSGRAPDGSLVQGTVTVALVN